MIIKNLLKMVRPKVKRDHLTCLIEQIKYLKEKGLITIKYVKDNPSDNSKGWVVISDNRYSVKQWLNLNIIYKSPKFPKFWEMVEI